MLEPHPHWLLVSQLEEYAVSYGGTKLGETCEAAADLIRELKREANDASRLRHPEGG